MSGIHDTNAAHLSLWVIQEEVPFVLMYHVSNSVICLLSSLLMCIISLLNNVALRKHVFTCWTDEVLALVD